MLSDREHRDLAQALLPVTLQAGAVEMKYFRTGVDVATKVDQTPVTIADQEAEALIASALQDIRPDIPIVGEEAASAGALPPSSSTYFLVDPLDGTRDFIAGREEFTVNIALVVAGQPVLGVVYQPPTGRLFMTVASDQALEAIVPVDENISSLDQITASRIATVAADQDNIRVAVSRSHRSAKLDAKLDQLNFSQRLKSGSSIKFCLVARGDADVYPRLTSISEWDTAAGHAIVTSAGGAVVGLDGQPLAYANVEGGYRVAPFVVWGEPDLAKIYSFA
ncbi:MAG: 3'(2'),5'-bisphosphate nucleotidase CysQ [Hyphomicrobiaceae bacterium]